MVAKKKVSRHHLWLEMVMGSLALVSGYMLVRELTDDLTPNQVFIFGIIDLVIAVVFLAEFGVKLYIAKNRMTYLKYHSWVLLAAIPVTTPLTQSLRLVRLLRLLHLLQAVEE
ncbi:hypothetical protein A3D71_04565 [Candidatus Kaiserbacteria bacterium RIFCSPHIGHO2_02_FULL_55_20]|uniref:Ion transport domain-containing protein n=1 Tax=Candidatus Kaiserbacteria bacterium RIFCSPHIGHO2_02_FULL_55_20 TaxID=1798497 RepID=A0A1F6DV57_9BACT|nr:MAG: hypothetical protein A2680_04150 [Candidatus Kaiserbacteria bacterium RIFCSPHIGHO2_01_FULL_55_37]OGG65324.1 MAG: hypothetical protein A3D71_04565 [Candidatus Kaiserbacteria bacterium RIFCSPHIGHO2_02_FULL_55_20]